MELHYLGYDDASIATAFIAARRAPGPDAALLASPVTGQQGRHVLSRAAYSPAEGDDAWSVTLLSTLTDQWGHGLHELHCGPDGERDDRCGPNGELCDCPCHLGLPMATGRKPSGPDLLIAVGRGDDIGAIKADALDKARELYGEDAVLEIESMGAVYTGITCKFCADVRIRCVRGGRGL
jgi:hypothetical protein